MTRIGGFPPLAAPDARTLVLGTVPGEASLRAGHYYAHPRNAFWPIVAEVFGFDAGLPYDARVAALLAHRVAVWDVLDGCVRKGSLDTAIDPRSAVPNDFETFLREHQEIRRICFNGAKAETLFDRHVARGLERPIDRVRLPSTSPANAAVPRGTKLRAWEVALVGTP